MGGGDSQIRESRRRGTSSRSTEMEVQPGKPGDDPTPEQRIGEDGIFRNHGPPSWAPRRVGPVPPLLYLQYQNINFCGAIKGSTAPAGPAGPGAAASSTG